jgi:hypothetical protein
VRTPAGVIFVMPLVGEHHALAADLVSGRDLGPQLGVLDHAVDLPARQRAEGRQQPPLAGHRRRAEVHEPEERLAVELLQ